MGGAFLTTLILDTHVWAWTLTDDPRISKRARQAIVAADAIVVSAISFFEIARKAQIGKWPEIEPYVDHLSGLLESQGATAISLEAEDCLMAGAMDWSHRDPFDRFLAASALRRRISIVSADSVFDGLLTPESGENDRPGRGQVARSPAPAPHPCRISPVTCQVVPSKVRSCS